MPSLSEWCDRLEAEIDGEPDLSLIPMLADWLEQRGDPRAEAVRGLIIMPNDPTGVVQNMWQVWPVLPGSDIPFFRDHADAARELFRRVLRLLTVGCPCRIDLSDGTVNARWDCCQGRGWLPAEAERCKACGGTGDDYGHIDHETTKYGTISVFTGKGHRGCPTCHGQGWVKAPEPVVRKSPGVRHR